MTWVQVKDGNYDLTIESRAFGGDKYLQAISLPKRTISIGYAAFDGDVKLKDVYYASTQKYYETYSDVNNGDSKNTAYLSAQMHYESSGPDEWPDTRYTGWVTVDGKNYICADCGAHNDHPMSAADLAAVNRITMLGGDSQELERLRKQYRNLDVTSWSSENRLQVK